MQPGIQRLSDWRNAPEPQTQSHRIEVLPSKAGPPTIKVDNVLLHSQYRPEEEATRFADGLDLDSARPVIVVGLGAGYHVRELMRRGFDVLVCEPDPSVAAVAARLVATDMDLVVAAGDPTAWRTDKTFTEYARRDPQVVEHPATARLHPEYAAAVRNAAATAMLTGKRLRVAIVGPMYGGSLPIADYLARAFSRLGHTVCHVNNDEGWPLFQSIEGSLRGGKPAAQLTGMLVNVLAEWCYARVMEFRADICIVLAQAPVRPDFPDRLREAGIVTAFWFVENWRHLGYWKDICSHYDCFFHIQPGEFESKLNEAGCAHHAVVLTGCDPEIHAPVQLSDEDQKQYACDLSFAGAGYANRNQMLSGLTDFDLKIWGVNWTARALIPHVQDAEQRFTPEMFAKIVAASKINLNLHSSAASHGVDPECDAVNPRVFEIAACGGFQLCDPCRGLDRYFALETEIPVYRNLAELRDRILYFLAHPDERAAIADRARDRSLRDHTYDHRAQRMLEELVQRHGERISAKGVLEQCSVGEMVKRLDSDTPLAAYLATLPPDTPFTQDAINEHLIILGKVPDYAEGIFMYLKDMRDAAEALLSGFEEA